MRLAGIEAGRISVVQNGLNYPYRRMGEEEALQHLEFMGLGDIRPFFLHVGNNNWYKNRDGVLREFAQIMHTGNQEWKLILAGQSLTPKLTSLARGLRISTFIRQAQNVTNNQLCALYSTAEALIFPSLAEGFGWPIIEAQACGCPVFTSNRKPMTEVGGKGAVYFDPLDEAGAAKIIVDALPERDVLIQHGYENVAKYSAQAMIVGYDRTYRLVTR